MEQSLHQPQYFYEEGEKQQIEMNKEHPELLERLRNSVPQCLQKLFKGNRILPYDLPDWLKEAITIKRLPLPGNEVDLDISIPKLFEAMHRQALKLLSDVKNLPFIQQAKEILLDMLSLVPKHAITLYNLSCAESLLGNKSKAVIALKSAVEEGGYNNVEHILKDEDLSNIRDMPQFQDLVQSLQKNSSTEEAMETDKPKDDMIDDWTQLEKEVQEPSTVHTPQLCVGELKWNEKIQFLKSMGFGQDDTLFGPRCVGLFEKYSGDITQVIDDLLH